MKTRREVVEEKRKTEKPKLNGLHCPECYEFQFEASDGSGTTCKNGHGGAPGIGPQDVPKDRKKKIVEEISSQLADELLPRPKKPSPFKFESANAARKTKLRPDLQKIVETIFVNDVHEIRERLISQLSVGEKRSDHGTLQKALDRAEKNAHDAYRLFVTAKVERERWERENDVIFGAMWTEATASLQKEKDDGIRAKQITDKDIQLRCATIRADEYSAQETERARIKATVDALENLAEMWMSRCRTLQAMLSKLRG